MQTMAAFAGAISKQAWVHKALRTLFAVAPGLAYFLLRGDPLGVSFAFATLCLSVPYNDQTFRPLHLVAMAGTIAILLPAVVWLQNHPVFYIPGIALMGAAGVLVTRSQKLPPRLTIWCLIYLLYQSGELQHLDTAFLLALLTPPAALWTYVVCFWLWPPRVLKAAKPTAATPLGIKMHASCAALSVACADAAVLAFHLSHGNWAIWSAYTVIRPNREVALERTARRALGAFIGCATGFLAIEAFQGMPLVLNMLTFLAVFFMVAFENYILAVALRSCLAALAAFALHYDPIATVEARFLGVLIGVTIGTLFVLAFTSGKPLHDQPTPQSGVAVTKETEIVPRKNANKRG